MGLCTSGMSEEEARAAREANIRNKKIEEDIRKDQQTDVRVFKLLLLGAGESGKSTLFKQMLCIYGEGFTQDQLNQYLPSIHQLVFSSMKTLTYQALERNLPFGDDSKAAVNYFRDLSDEEALLDADSAKFVKALWKEKSIREVYEHRAQFYLVDSCAYFFDNVDRIAHPSYSPNYEDVLKCRVRTTGIVESKFTIAAHQFMLVDVGGQRNERKKWIHCFEGVTAVIFVAAISEYDQMLFEDASVSRTIEALNLFDEVLNLKWFSQKPVLLFLNKRDLFAEKIKTNPLSKHWPDYTGDGSYESSVDYMRNKYLERVPAERKSQVYAHVVCATDQENVAHVFNDVKDIIIRRALQGSGLDFGN